MRRVEQPQSNHTFLNPTEPEKFWVFNSLFSLTAPRSEKISNFQPTKSEVDLFAVNSKLRFAKARRVRSVQLSTLAPLESHRIQLDLTNSFVNMNRS